MLVAITPHGLHGSSQGLPRDQLIQSEVPVYHILPTYVENQSAKALLHCGSCQRGCIVRLASTVATPQCICKHAVDLEVQCLSKAWDI